MYWESQVLLVVTLWLSGVVVDQKFTSEGVDERTHLFIDHCRVKFVFLFFFVC